jgi:hypothetical protein
MQGCVFFLSVRGKNKKKKKTLEFKPSLVIHEMHILPYVELVIIEKGHNMLSEEHNILEPVLGQPSGYSAKYCSKSLLKRDFIPFLSNYAHSSTATCMFIPL